mgnify:FL=1
MARIINGSIDLKKIDKSKIKPHANGALYYDVTIYVNDEPNKFGQDVSIAASISKEEREAGVKQTYIGNGKTVKNTEPQSTPPPHAATSGTANYGKDDLPF